MPTRDGGLRFIVLLVGLLAQACRGGSSTPLRIAHEAPLVSLDPAKAADSISRSVLSNFYDALVDYDAQMHPIPALALSWSSPDDHTWLLPLRQSVRTHDGGLLSPEDVRFSLERARTSPDSALKDRLVTLESVEIIEGTTVRIRTRVPDPIMLERLTDIFIAPERRTGSLGSRPVGTGSYRWLETKDGALEAQAFDGCWRGHASVPRARFLSESADQAIALLKQGKVDVLRWVPENRKQEIEGFPRTHVVARPGLRAVYLWMRSLQEPGKRVPLADARVRRAISLAIDRDAVVARLGGGSLPLRRFFPPGVLGYNSAATLLTYAPDESRRLLAEAGYPRGFSSELVYAPGGDGVIDIVVPMLREVGIELKPRALVWTEMLPLWQSARLPLFMGSWWFSSGDASQFLKECLGTRRAGEPNGWNPGYSDEHLDHLIEEDFQILGTPARIRHSEVLLDYLVREMPLVPLVNRADLYAVSSRVTWRPRLDGRLLAAEMTLH